MNSDNRKQVPVKNNPGIFKLMRRDQMSGHWLDTGKFLTTRRTREQGKSKRQTAVFDNLADAKDFRVGKIDRISKENAVHRISSEQIKAQFTFGDLVEDWKRFHFLKVKRSSAQFYEKKLPYLDFLKNKPVKDIDVSAIDALITHWVKEYPKKQSRASFDRELTVLTVVLNFYKRRRDGSFVIPVMRDHYEAATLVTKAKGDVAVLSEADTMRFFTALRDEAKPFYAPLAYTQFGLALRIGEVCGLFWEDLDLEAGYATIHRVVCLDEKTRESYFQECPKNERIRRLVIPEFVIQELKQWKAKRDPTVSLVFHNNGLPLQRKSVGAMYNKVLKRIGVTYVTGTHIMRKAAATIVNDLTGDVHTVSNVLDHSSVAITERYVKRLPSQRRKFADALDSAFGKKLELPTPPNLDVKAVQNDSQNGAGQLWPTERPKPKLFLVKTGT